MGVTLRRGTRLVIASHNEGKVREIADLLAPFGVEAVSAGKLGLPEPEETGDSFAENASAEGGGRGTSLGAAGARRRFRAGGQGTWRRARHPFGALGRSGKGFRARHGARASRAGSRRRQGLEPPISPARWRLPRPTARSEVFEGKVFGTIAWPPRGTRGFGYDPIFVPEGYKRDIRRDGAELERLDLAPRPRLREADVGSL